MTTRWLYNNPLTLQTNLNILHRNGGVFTVIEHKKNHQKILLTLWQPADFTTTCWLCRQIYAPYTETKVFPHSLSTKKSPKIFADFMSTRWLYNNLLTLQTNLNILHWNRGVFTVIEYKKKSPKKFCWLYDNLLTLQQPADFADKSMHPTLKQRCFHTHPKII